jgi:hypothetical protein
MNAAATTHQHTNCLRCGRALRSAKSTATGYGPTCTRKVKAAAVTQATSFKPAQIAKAVELIEQGGVIPLRRNVFRTVSSDGTRSYLTAPQACNCAAGLKGKHMCFHRIAAQIVTAA